MSLFLFLFILLRLSPRADHHRSNFPDAWNGSAGYNHNFYRLIFELLLRLRANYLWPTVWGSIFYTDDPLNQPLADAFEIVLGSSHTEPMMRAQNEFKTYYTGPWAYNLNNKTIDAYFRYGAQRARPYTRNSLYTMAMRGTGDNEIEGGLGLTGIIDMLEVLVHRQQEIIVEELDVANASVVPQMWCLYKEVQTYQEHGLHVPEDITLLWADDNWGNVRRLPLANETARAGGAGVYFHFDYVGDPRDYKWINTVQLQRTTEQVSCDIRHGYGEQVEANLCSSGSPTSATPTASGSSTSAISRASSCPSATTLT